MILAGGQLWMVHHIWQRNALPPWDVLGVEWHPRAKTAWHFASMRVRLESGADQLLTAHDRQQPGER
jgi:hypothetical protein